MTRMQMAWQGVRGIIALAAASGLIRAQATPAVAIQAPAASVADQVAEWIALPAAPGHERAATDIIARSVPGWTRDAAGNLVAHQGAGTPRRVVACGLDEAAYVVSEITDDGYLRLHMDGRARRSPLWDQFHEGQRVRILTASGARPGVVAVRSTHLWRGRGAGEPVVTVEDLWVDVGARARGDVTALGITVLDPVIREWPPWRMADMASGPAAGDRAGCAAVAAVAGRAPAAGETTWVVSVRHAFAYDGLAAALARLGHVDSLFVLDAALATDSGTAPAPAVRRVVLPSSETRWARGRAGAVVAVAVRTQFPGTLAETVRGADVAALINDVAAASGAGSTAATTPSQSVALRGVPGPPPTAPVTDSLSVVARTLAHLADTYGVSGREAPVRRAVQSELPAAWRREPTRVDTAGNLILEAGPNRDTVVIVAHMDEIGYRVVHIDHDGVATLAPLGGFYGSLWEGQPALAHVAVDREAGGGAPVGDAGCGLAPGRGAQAAGMPVVAGTVPGVFRPRAQASTQQPDSMAVWFGADSARLAGCGITVGTRVSGYKQASRLGATRFTARSIDDRAGCTAVLEALRAVDPATLAHKVIVVFSVREEVGLDGAAAEAAALGPTVHRVHAVDTFVSSDSPLESHRFAFAPLGRGAALRSLDNSSVTPPAEIARAQRIAAAHHIPVQTGTTNGGNDGSVFVPWGAIDVPVGWPLRYSHSPAEVSDLEDVRGLGRLVAALMQDARD